MQQGDEGHGEGAAKAPGFAGGGSPAP
uniref:Uncharacterized protein n=1 Tax=Arundo donax TaxID=35708 RepID=A0A0A9BQH8_ARUDO